MASLDDSDSPCVSILSTSEIVGLSFIAESGVISTVAVLVFAALVIRNILYVRRNPGPNGPAPLIKTHVDGYIISLMFADLLQGIGAITSAKWAADGRVVCSSYCTAQGAIQQLGESGVAMSTLVITLHTFATVFLRWNPTTRPYLWIIVVTCIWVFLILFVALGYSLHPKGGADPYFGPTPFWCWIGPAYMAERIAGEYFWLWFCAFINIIVYPFLFFTLRGNIEVDPGNWRRIRFHKRTRDGPFGHLPTRQHDSEDVMKNKARNKEAMKMFWYPISYTFLVLPLSINRWLTFRSKSKNEPVRDISIVPTSIVLFIFGLSGLCNVLLFLFTRPNLLLFGLRRTSKRYAKMAKEHHFINTAVSYTDGVIRQRNSSNTNNNIDDDDDRDPDGDGDYSFASGSHLQQHQTFHLPSEKYPEVRRISSPSLLLAPPNAPPPPPPPIPAYSPGSSRYPPLPSTPTNRALLAPSPPSERSGKRS